MTVSLKNHLTGALLTEDVFSTSSAFNFEVAELIHLSINARIFVFALNQYLSQNGYGLIFTIFLKKSGFVSFGLERTNTVEAQDIPEALLKRYSSSKRHVKRSALFFWL